MSNARELLKAFELQGEFLFHGSPLMLKQLIPVQPFNESRITGRRFKDGKPCVVATHIADIAIFRAITHLSQFPAGEGYGSSFGVTSNGAIRLEVMPKTAEAIVSKKGYVYVLTRGEFQKRRRSKMEWRTPSVIVPLHIIPVSFEDFPKFTVMRELSWAGG